MQYSDKVKKEYFLLPIENKDMQGKHPASEIDA